jgi:hypothetical protein
VKGRPIVIRLEPRLEDNSLTGRARGGAGATREFVGWMGLVAAIDALVREFTGRGGRLDEAGRWRASCRAPCAWSCSSLSGQRRPSSLRFNLDPPAKAATAGVLKAALRRVDNPEGISSLLYGSQRKG